MGAYAFDAGDDAVPHPEVTQQPAGHARRLGRAVDHQHRIHALPLRSHPVAADAGIGREDGGAVEVLRGDAWLGHDLEAGVGQHSVPGLRFALLVRDG